MKNTIMLLTGSLSCAGVSVAADLHAQDSPKRPNVIIIFTDDQGYGDVAPFGSKIPTPNVDRMAEKGIKLTDFYVAASVSTPSRAALMTGCYPKRVDMPQVLFPRDNRGLNPSEMTIPEMLKQSDYTTACVGKWHLGHRQHALPLQHGFDEYFGIPYSNDMPQAIQGAITAVQGVGIPDNPSIPLMLGNEVLEFQPDQDQLTTRYAEYCVDFIARNKENPFFLYMAHSMPHVPLGVSDKFRGKSGINLYSDVIMEIDWSIGEIYKALREAGIEDNTLVIYASDNGPSLMWGNHGGTAGPLREGKTTAYEGGQRVFCLMTWPGVIAAGSECDELTSTIDVLPTLAAITGGKLSDNKIDGENIYPLITGVRGAKTPHEAFYFYNGVNPFAIRMGDWKFHVDHPYRHVVIPGVDGKVGKVQQLRSGRVLYNLKDDIAEQENLVDTYSEIADMMEKKLMDFDREVTENMRHAEIKN